MVELTEVESTTYTMRNADDFVAGSAEVGIRNSGLAENEIGLSDGAEACAEESAQTFFSN